MNKSRWGASFMLFALGMILLAGCYPMVEVSEERTATFPVSGRLELKVNGQNGHIDVRGESGLSEVRVLARLKAGAPSRDTAEELLQEINLEMYQEGNVVTLRHTQHPDLTFGWGRNEGVSFEIVIPREADLSLTTSNGRIDFENIAGNVAARTNNGRIESRDTQGNLEMRTSNGAIEAVEANGAFHASTSNGSIQFYGRLVGQSHSAHSSNGSISIRIPADLELSIHASVGNGHISSSLPLYGDRDGKRWAATLNSDLAQLELSTSNGSISIRELHE